MGAEKEPRLSHGGKVGKMEFGNFERILGNSNSEFGVGKNIGDEDAEDETHVFSKVQA